MVNNSLCPSCKNEIPADAPGGLCPSCILAAGFVRSHPSPFNSTALFDAGRARGFAAPSPEQLNTCLPDLLVEKLIGQGGMGAVYRARQRRLDRVVALKILAPSLGTDPTFAERFAREARTLAKLSHPNIVTVFEFGNVDTMYYLIMEFVDGINLRDAIRNKTITAEQALEIVPQVCEALQFAHDEGIVHRDIKPENILLNQRGHVKIADFGLAKILDHDPVEFQLTGTHQIMGTRNYMAPEQIEKPHAVDHRADLYSLGVVFYELLTGELPIGRFANPSAKVPVSASLDGVVLKTLEKEPDQRYQQASEIMTAVKSLNHPDAAEKKEAGGPQPAERQRYPQSAMHMQQAANQIPFANRPAEANRGMGSPQQEFPISPIAPQHKTNSYCPFTIPEENVGLTCAYGIAKFDGSVLSLEYEIRDEVFGGVKSGPFVINIPSSEIVSVRLKEGAFNGQIQVSTTSVSIANPVPGGKQGKFKLKIKRADFPAARILTQALEQSLALPPEKRASATPMANTLAPQFAHALQTSPIDISAQKNQDKAEVVDADTKKLTEKVSAPASALAVVAVLNIVFNAPRIVKFVGNMFRSPFEAVVNANPIGHWNSDIAFSENLLSTLRRFSSVVFNPFGSADWLITIAISIAILYGTSQMKKFRRYPICIAVMVIAMLPFYQLYVLGLAFAIWGFCVLLDQEVRAQFEKLVLREQKYYGPPNTFKGTNETNLIRALMLALGLVASVLFASAVILFATWSAMPRAIPNQEGRKNGKQAVEVNMSDDAPSQPEQLESPTLERESSAEDKE
ncbi:MAG TPA: serine/threonine-protein kinase [Pirellulaceae bacterium]|nr:serine/threonine-protein kinase [Pirellulaceae bacterium]HMO91983.1 serine/threonine-protein kinase [Pirellulaceae bacterium]HMP68782.1 serine/threonine-protein kinase [Pirellulaceae bacterium]